MATGAAGEAGKRSLEAAGVLVRRIAGREVPAPATDPELAAVARTIHEGVRRDPALARAWTALARAAPAGPEVRRVPALPAPTRFFTDRDGPLKDLVREAGRRADGRPRVALLHGPEGIGTSELALFLGSREAKRFPHGQIRIDLRGGSAGTALDPGAVLYRALLELGLADEEIPAAPDDRTRCFRQCVAGLKLLLVLDHAYSAAQVAPLLTAASGVFTLVVARRPLPGLDALPVPVGPLGRKDALKLLTLLAGGSVPGGAREALPGLLAECGGSPYALRVAAPWLGDGTWGTAGVPEGDPVRRAAEIGHRRLAADTARVYRLMALRAWTDIGVAAVAATVRITGTEAARHLVELADRQLLEPAGAGRYRYRPAIRRHAEAAAEREDGPAACAEAVRRAVGHHLRFALRAGLVALPQSWRTAPRARELGPGPYRDAGAAIDALSADLGNLVEAAHAAEESGDTDTVELLGHALWPYQLKAGRYEELLPALRSGARTATGRRAGQLHFQLGMALAALKDFDAAESELRAAAEAEWQAGHVRGRASAVEALGLLRLGQWRYEEAYGLFTEAGAVYDTIGDGEEGAADLPRARALVERHKGRALRGIPGRRGEALERLGEALSRFRGAGEAYNTARTLTDLAEVRLDAGEAEAALPLIDEAEAALAQERAEPHLAVLRDLRSRCVTARE
ncbi:tetratricopeptide repeat protein [Streptomyces beijiangensis]|uniref:Tetratricopeptide repeat protein n=2 Tax=Streptomyces beijiangensis TaxID=163361 RepID=A0A939F6X2_9ACTN|nr:tetratricopeptide repeat protein [Streptomyces beijiangensis]